MIVFNWQEESGDVENWNIQYLSQRRRYVYNAFASGVAIGIDLQRAAVQLVWMRTGRRQTINFIDVVDDDLRDALEAVVAIPGALGLRTAMSLLLHHLGHEDLAIEITAGAVDDLPEQEPQR